MLSLDSGRGERTEKVISCAILRHAVCMSKRRLCRRYERCEGDLNKLAWRTTRFAGDSHLLAIEYELPGAIDMLAILGSVHLRADRRRRDMVGMLHVHLLVLLLEKLKLLCVMHMIRVCARAARSRHVEIHSLRDCEVCGRRIGRRGIGMREGQPAHRRVKAALPIVETSELELGVEVEKFREVIVASDSPIHGIILHFLRPYHRLLVVLLRHVITRSVGRSRARRWAAGDFGECDTVVREYSCLLDRGVEDRAQRKPQVHRKSAEAKLGATDGGSS